jgi:hypothetical protein
MLGRVMLELRAADAARGALILSAAAASAAGAWEAGLALALAAVGAVALRAVTAPPLLDTALCCTLLAAQLGALASLTESTWWWDVTAHALVSAFLAAIASATIPAHTSRRALAAVAILVGGVGSGGVRRGCHRRNGSCTDSGRHRDGPRRRSRRRVCHDRDVVTAAPMDVSGGPIATPEDGRARGTWPRARGPGS